MAGGGAVESACQEKSMDDQNELLGNGINKPKEPHYPDGLCLFPSVISHNEAADLLNFIDGSDDESDQGWTIEGYERRRRVQRYDRSEYNTSSETGSLGKKYIMEDVFGFLIDRIMTQIGKIDDDGTRSSASDPVSRQRPNELIIEEFYPTGLSDNGLVTTFETVDNVCGCKCDNCSCFVAQIPILGNAIQHLNRPEVRDVECWNLLSPDDSVDIPMDPNSLLLKSGSCLWDWRNRIRVPSIKGKEAGPEEGRVVILKFRCLSIPETNTVDTALQCNLEKLEISLMPPLEDLLTIIVTTSPIKSNPSTELLEQIFGTFHYAGDDFTFKCKKVIVCDGCRIKSEPENVTQSSTTKEKKKVVTKKHSNVKQALRSGIATSDQAENYALFKKSLTKLCHEANEIADSNDLLSPFYNTRVVELESRHGYGFALRHALQNCVTTPYVCVIQHDRTFMRRTPIREVVQTMRNDQRIKYVGINMRSNLVYRDIFTGKYGKTANTELGELVLRPPELLLDSKEYGPEEGFTANRLEISSEKMKKNVTALAQAYRGSSQYNGQLEWQNLNPENKAGLQQLSLTPTLFWYDNTHVCETSHYRDFIFNPLYKMVARGGFVEEKLSPVMIRSCERLGLREGHAKFGCYLLDDHSGMFFTGHLDGGSYIALDDRKKERKKYNETNKVKK
eukprot:scaffold36408_cov53-Attheya_sp.AAC.4